LILLAAVQVGLQLLCPSNTEAVSPVPLSPSISASAAAGVLFNKSFPRPEGEFIVQGEVRYSLPLLVVRRLVFKRGSHLIIDLPTDRGADFTIVAHSIDVDEPDEPGLITWDPGPNPTVPQSSAEPASRGAPGRAPGGPGASGNSGTDGTSGIPGKSAPSITIIVQAVHKLPGIALCGQTGGQGASGQPGGQGGRGGPGEPAVLSAFNCVRGAGNGGPGGAGGNGGRGGRGGQGGDGGSVVFLIPREEASLQSASVPLLHVYAAGGRAGPGGSGAPGGPGGEGGEGGHEQLPWCRGSGSPGQIGSPGTEGGDGTPGQEGKQGSASVGFLDSKQFKYLMQGAK
jgi:hypothetical protein